MPEQEVTIELPASETKAKLIKSARQPRIKRYGFDVTGNLYDISRYGSEQWEALKKKLGKVIEVEAANQTEAWKLYDQIKRRD